MINVHHFFTEKCDCALGICSILAYGTIQMQGRVIAGNHHKINTSKSSGIIIEWCVLAMAILNS